MPDSFRINLQDHCNYNGEQMKREVWVEMPESEMSLATCHLRAHGRVIPMRHETLHESRWIPVIERIPTVSGHYQIVRLNRTEWAYFNKGHKRWSHSDVTHWLEAPPLPVEDEFEKWWNENGDKVEHRKSYYDLSKSAWNAAKESK